MAKKEGKRRSVKAQMDELLRQWDAALSSDNPQRAVEDLIAEYEERAPGSVNAQLAREALRERISQDRAAESEKALSPRRGSGPRAPRR